MYVLEKFQNVDGKTPIFFFGGASDDTEPTDSWITEGSKLRQHDTGVEKFYHNGEWIVMVSRGGSGGGSSALPPLTAQDEGKALVAQSGAWTTGSGTRVVEAVINQSGGVELQDVTLEDLYNLVQNNIVVYGSVRMEVGPDAYAYSITKLETIVSGGGTFFALFVGTAEGKLTTCTFEASETGTMREYQTLPAFDENDIGKIPMVVSDGEGGARVGWYTPT